MFATPNASRPGSDAFKAAQESKQLLDEIDKTYAPKGSGWDVVRADPHDISIPGFESEKSGLQREVNLTASGRQVPELAKANDLALIFKERLSGIFRKYGERAVSQALGPEEGARFLKLKSQYGNAKSFEQALADVADAGFVGTGVPFPSKAGLVARVLEGAVDSARPRVLQAQNATAAALRKVPDLQLTMPQILAGIVAAQRGQQDDGE
jgi:hypothetical protein